MVERSEYELERIEFEAEALKYFQALGLRVPPSTVLEYMLRRGVLVERGGRILFKYAAFCHFFIAKRLIEDKSALEIAVSPSRYLEFRQELDLLTGLQRNNDGILRILGGYLEEAAKDAGPEIDVELFDHIGAVDKEPLSEEGRARLVERYADRPGPDERDEVLEAAYEPIRRTPAQMIRRSSPQAATGKLLETLILFSEVLRNCELVAESIKRPALLRALELWSQLTVALSLVAEELVEDGTYQRMYANFRAEMSKGNDREGEPPYGEEMFRDLMRLATPMFVQALVYASLGTPKLGPILAEYLEQPAPTATRLVQLCLYSELRLPKYLMHAKHFVSSRPSRYVLEIFLIQMGTLYMFRKLSRDVAKEHEEVVADILTSLSKSGTHLIDVRRKSQAMAELRKRRRDLFLTGDDDS
jgi:hypothetical protein